MRWKAQYLLHWVMMMAVARPAERRGSSVSPRMESACTAPVRCWNQDTMTASLSSAAAGSSASTFTERLSQAVLGHRSNRRQRLLMRGSPHRLCRGQSTICPQDLRKAISDQYRFPMVATQLTFQEG